MSRRLNACTGWFLVMASFFAMSGCGVRGTETAMPTVTSFSWTVGNGRMSLIQGYELLTIVICSDIRNGSYGGSGKGTSNPPAHKSVGFEVSEDGRRLDWTIEKRNGQKTTCRFNNQDFDLQKGTLFLVKTKGGESKIDQLNQDLSGIRPNSESLTAFAKKNSDVSVLLEIVENKK